jgi:sugar/nucleoside kinase (ribokinase family)
MSILCVGSVALDSLRTPSGARDDALGGSATYFSVAASFFAHVDLVAVVGSDFPKEHVDFLASRSVGLEGLEHRTGRTFRWKGEYSWDLNEAHTLSTELNVFESFSPKIPAALLKPEWLFLGNIDPELQIAVLDQVARPKLVAADSMNYWITGKPDALAELLARIDLLFINDGEARQLAGESNIVKAAMAIQRMGPGTVCIKRGEYGAMLFLPDTGQGGKVHETIFAAPAMPLVDVKDPTGAGDSFAGGFLGTLARAGETSPAALRLATITGTVLASFTVEDFGLDRLRNLERMEIDRRLDEFRRLTFTGATDGTHLVPAKT